MISHLHKVIFIHISKCAGSSIETALDVDISNLNANYENLFGWCDKRKIYLHHATPDELFEYNYINKNVWDDYFKVIIIRNPWDRAYSDYKWMKKELKLNGSFKDFVNAEGKFKKRLTVKNKSYRGDHLNTQKSYFFLNGNLINYDMVLRFENLKNDLPILANRLKLAPDAFGKKKNQSKSKLKHYSHFYNSRRIKEFEKVFQEDIDFLDYSFDDQRNSIDKFKSYLPSYYF